MNRFLEQIEVHQECLDIVLVDKQTGLPLGRPWLTCIIEKGSKLVVGYAVGLAGPAERSGAK